MAEEALFSKWNVQSVIFTNGLSERGRHIVNEFVGKGVDVEEISVSLMNELSEMETTQGIIVFLGIKTLPLPSSPNFIFVPAEVRDPGNLGTILRTAAAANVDAVLIPPDTVDMYAPKVVRAAMGAHFRLPIVPMSWENIRCCLENIENMKTYLADIQGGTIYTSLDYHGPTTLIVGGEAFGAGDQAKALTKERIFIPMGGTVESLNVAIAAAILLFEVVRQRH
jgi:TrmH family RNA methyltransferase